MKDPEKVRDLIIEKLDFASVMEEYGVSFVHNPHIMSEVQYRCPFHGPDNKPSARLYNKTKSSYCWTCHKSWNVISFIMDKEGLYYRQALNYIVNRFHIDLSSIPDTPVLELKKTAVSEKDILMKSVRSLILEIRGKIPFEKYRALCGLFFMIKYKDYNGFDVMNELGKLEEKVLCLKRFL